MENEKKIMIRLPESMIKELEEMVVEGKYASLSEAIRDCVQKNLDPTVAVDREIKDVVHPIKMEKLVKEEISMDELIHKAAKKYTKDHL